MVFTGFSCTINNSNSSIKKRKYYSDIDIFNLKGKNELTQKKLKFPFLIIDSINKVEKKIEFHFNKNLVFQRSYIKKDTVWKSEHIVKDFEEGVTFYFYEFITKNKIIKLEYNGFPKDSSLISLTITEKNRVYFYEFDPGVIKFIPTHDVRLLPLEKCYKRGISEFSIENEILTFRTKLFNIETNEVIKEDVNCYEINKLSYVWWRYFGHKFKKINCS